MPRIFVRGVTSEDYGLREFRERQLATSRVRSADGDDHESLSTRGAGVTSLDDEELGTRNHIDPADDPFLTQTILVHLKDYAPHSKAAAHGHQNEAIFYILDGSGYEIHDGERYEWSAGDLVVVHTDSVHEHFNPNDEPATLMMIKAKATWMFMGLTQQGRSHQMFVDDTAAYGPRVDWSQIWSTGVAEKEKVIKPGDRPWQMTPMGHRRQLTDDAVRLFSVEVTETEIPLGSHSGRRWQMADEVNYIRSGSGYSLHWRVEAEIDERFYARIANEPTRHDFKAGETLYVPQNTVAQHFSTGGEPLFMISAKNSMFRRLGYDKEVFLEPAPEYGGAARPEAIADLTPTH